MSLYFHKGLHVIVMNKSSFPNLPTIAIASWYLSLMIRAEPLNDNGRMVVHPTRLPTSVATVAKIIRQSLILFNVERFLLIFDEIQIVNFNLEMKIDNPLLK